MAYGHDDGCMHPGYPCSCSMKDRGMDTEKAMEFFIEVNCKHAETISHIRSELLFCNDLWAKDLIKYIDAREADKSIYKKYNESSKDRDDKP